MFHLQGIMNINETLFFIFFLSLNYINDNQAISKSGMFHLL